MHNQAPIQRRKSKRIYVGNVPIGDGAPIAVQSMTNTRTTDVAATVNQIKALERVGADIVRVSVPTMDAAEAFKLIKQQVNVPLVADIHFDYRIALKVAEYGVDCLRINPGNIGNEERIRMVVDCARDKNIPIRIGVNAGSLEKDLQEKYGEPTPQALLESAMRHVDHLDRLNFDQFKVSVKASDVFLAVESYRLLAKQIDQPLHLGITEAGGARSGAVKSAIGLGLLLSEGIGDTLRVSLAADPVEEIKVGFDILKSLRIRSRGINFIACPTCSRQEFDVIGTVNALEQRLEDIITPMDVSIIGCVVNGPGEALVSTLGVTGGNKKSGLYEDGVRKDRLDNNDMIDQLEARIRAKASMLDEARRIDVQQVEAILQKRHQDCTDNCCTDGAVSTSHGCSTKNCCNNGISFITSTSCRVAAVNTSCIQNARQSCECAAQRVSDCTDNRKVNTGKSCSLIVRTNCEDMSSNNCLLQNEGSNQAKYDGIENRERNYAE